MDHIPDRCRRDALELRRIEPHVVSRSQLDAVVAVDADHAERGQMKIVQVSEPYSRLAREIAVELIGYRFRAVTRCAIDIGVYRPGTPKGRGLTAMAADVE